MKEYRIKNVESQPVMTHTLSKSTKGQLRNKLTILNFAGMKWKDKRDVVQNEMINAFGEIPDGVSFVKRKTRKCNNNPDGLRVFVRCEWIRRQRFHDYKGNFHMGTLIKAVNKQIEGQTKGHILNPEYKV